MGDDLLSLRLDDGTVLFDERDVESYDPASGIFVLVAAASQRLVENWRECLQDPEEVVPTGALLAADGKHFVAALGGEAVAEGTVAAAPLTLATWNMRGTLVCVAPPTFVDGRLQLLMGRLAEGRRFSEPMEFFKAFIESGPDRVLAPVDDARLAGHLRALGKVSS